MAGSLTREVLKRGAGPPGGGPDFGDGGGPGGRGASRRASLTGLLVLIAASTMFFAALTSAFVVRRGLSDDWVRLPVPGLLWLNSAVLLASGAAIETARRALKSGARSNFNKLWTLGTALGILFLAGQFAAWRQLHAAGVYVATNPSSSFFFVLTVAHAAHLVGGVVALLYVNMQAWRLRLGPGKRTVVEVGSFYWHFLDGLWIYLMILFSVWG